MTAQTPLQTFYFSDMLCIWAYVAQIRLDELKRKFGDKIQLNHHFIEVFGDVEGKIEHKWQHRGGIEAYSKHVLEIGQQFDHIEVHCDIWRKNVPLSSASCHLFLKAIQLLQAKGEFEHIVTMDHKTVFESVMWQLRNAFFTRLVDISQCLSQMEVAEKMHLPIDKIQRIIDSGEAFAALQRDAQLKETYRVYGSPTIVFNHGRQVLYGNVGYRVIEANVEELLYENEAQASWC